MDSSAFLAGFDSFSIREEQITVPGVEEELRSNSLTWLRFKIAIENGIVKIETPSEKFLRMAKRAANEAGDSFSLSDTDLQVLALGLELKAENCKPCIVTDDYSIQNVASLMDMKFAPLATFGIKRLLEWIKYCPACHREYQTSTTLANCTICGTSLKRKPLRTIRDLTGKSFKSARG